MYKVRIINNPAGYEVQIKKHWWSRWETKKFIGMSSESIEFANNLLSHDIKNENKKCDNKFKQNHNTNEKKNRNKQKQK